MAPTRNAPSIFASIGKIYSGISFINPLLLLNLGLAFALSKAIETSNLEKANPKIPGMTPRLTSSGLFQATSMIFGGGIMKPVGWLITDPARNILGAFAPDSRRESDFRGDHQQQDGALPDGALPSPGGAVASPLHSQLSPQPPSRFSFV